MFSSKLTAAVGNSNIPIVKVFVFRLEAVSRKGSRDVSGKDFRPNSHSPLVRKKKKLSKFRQCYNIFMRGYYGLVQL